MGFFKRLFGASDDEQHKANSDDLNGIFDNSDEDSFGVSEKNYALAKVRVQGIEDLDQDDRDYIINELEEDTHVYLRNEFDNPKDCHALQVLYHSHLIGYIDKNKSKLVHSYLRESKIGAVVISKIKSKDFSINVELNIFYEDPRGEEWVPSQPENRQVSVLETEFWIGQEDWSKDWFMDVCTNELLYKYNDMYDDTVDEDERNTVDVELLLWINSYLDGTCITRKGCNHYLERLESDCAKKVLMKRIESYLEHKGYHFADKELFSDDNEVD